MRPRPARLIGPALVAGLLAATGLVGTHPLPAFATVTCGTNGVMTTTTTGTSTTITCMYTSAGEGTFNVPGGVSTVTVEAIGANGGGYGTAPGSDVKASISGLAGISTLYVEVGGAGLNGSGNSSGPVVGGPGGAGGFNGGGNGGIGVLASGGNGGGGASDVRTIPRTASNTLSTRLVVASGGGGAPGFGSNLGGLGGGIAGIGCSSHGTCGGGGGSATGGGRGGAGAIPSPSNQGQGGTAGSDGALGKGGDGASGAGGGGGGYYGGGGGGGGLNDPVGGGGGGGSDLTNGSSSGAQASPIGTPVASVTASSVTISYTYTPSVTLDNALNSAQATAPNLAATLSGHMGTLTVANYTTSPTNPSNSSFGSGTSYFDVKYNPTGPTDPSTASIMVLRCGAASGDTLSWFDGTSWKPVTPAATYDAATGCLSVTLDQSSSPSVSQLGGTPFALVPAGSGSVINCTPTCASATPELGSGELLATGLLPIGAVLLYRRRRTRRALPREQ